MSQGLLPPLKPLPIKERESVVFVERGEIDMLAAPSSSSLPPACACKSPWVASPA